MFSAAMALAFVLIVGVDRHFIPLPPSAQFAFPLPLIGVCWYGWWCRRRLVRAVERLEYHPCPDCFYDLRAVEPVDPDVDGQSRVRCPECGAAVNLEQSSVWWYTWARPRFR